MKWINAENELPADDDVVLIWDHQGCYFLASYFEGQWDTVDMKPVTVAYWMRLPACPAAVDDLSADVFEDPLLAGVRIAGL